MKKTNKRKSIPALCLAIIFFTGSYTVLAQNGTSTASGPQLNAIQTAVPFMTITPDSRAGAMGDVGVATSTQMLARTLGGALGVTVMGAVMVSSI